MTDQSDKNVLTVIVVTYNHVKYIARCLDSIISQKTNFNFVIKIVDDCSTDGTSNIVREYELKYPDKINVIIRDENLGVLDSLYPILCSVDTNYFCVIDGDDYLIDNNKFQIQVNALENNKDCCICAHKTKVVEYPNKESFIGLKDGIGNKILDIYNCPYLHTSSRMYKNILNYSNEDKKIIWDIFSFYKYLSMGNLYYIDKIMSVYNRTGQGMDSCMTKDIAKLEYMKTSYELDLYFKFKYTKIFRKNYLPELCSHEYLNKWEWKIPRWYRFIQKLIWNK